MKTVCLILAGGKGTRFWPKSRTKLPKQFLCIDSSGKTLIQKTVDRISSLVCIEDIFVVTNEKYKQLVLTQIGDLPVENVICEPIGRNTAPAIGLGIKVVSRKYEDCNMIVLPSDHFVSKEKEYINILNKALDFVENNDALITLGIKPTSANVNYGYIHYDDSENNVKKVLNFKEKPDCETATKYLEDGRYLWNAGMFVWKLSNIVKALKKYCPQLYDGLCNLDFDDIAYTKKFSLLEPISIDYAVMEKANNIYTIESDIGWDDVGDWDAVARINGISKEGNTVVGDNVVLNNASNCTVDCNGKKLVVLSDVNDLLVVETDDVTLVAKKGDSRAIQRLIDELHNKDKDKYL